ncbi:MAG: hypothetical protein IJM45_10400 [Clostridia bacterium]|nr:hypothetical protein [Clostridia bacterium]
MKKMIGRYRYGAWIFLLGGIYAFVFPGALAPWREGAVPYVFYLVDYSMGFCTRFLPGAVYKLLIGVYTHEAETAFVIVLQTLFFAAASLVCGRLVSRVESENRPCVLLLLFFLFTGPYSLSIFSATPGMLDFYWLLFSFAAVLLIANKKTVWLAVPFFALLILVHYASVFTYIPLLALLLLYKAVYSPGGSERRTYVAVLAVSLALAAGLFVYFVLFERSNLTYPLEEFAEILYSRGAGKGMDVYYDYVLYRDLIDPETKARMAAEKGLTDFGGDASALTGGLAGLIRVVLQQIGSTVVLWDLDGKVPAMLISLPAAALLFVFVFYIVKKEHGFMKRLALVGGPLVYLLAAVGGCLFSSDINRWLSHAFVALFVFVLFLMNERRGCEAFFKKAFKRLPSVLIFAYMFIYAVTVVAPYD